MLWGTTANAITTGLAALAYAAAAMRAYLRQHTMRRPIGAGPYLFGAIAAYLAIAALRQVAALISQDDPSYVDVDRTLYYVVVIPAALVIVPHVHLVSLVRWGDPRRSLAIAGVFLAIVLVGIGFGYAGGVEGPVVSDYGTDWSLRSPVTKVLLVGAIMLPGLIGSAGLVAMSRDLPLEDRRRVRLIGWSCLAYFLVFTADAFGLSGVALLAARVAQAGTGLLAVAAYSTKRVDYTPEPFKPGEGPYLG